MILSDLSSFIGSVWAVGLALVVGVGAGYYLRSKKQF
jgi:hypothetical protein